LQSRQIYIGLEGWKGSCRAVRSTWKDSVLCGMVW